MARLIWDWEGCRGIRILRIVWVAGGRSPLSSHLLWRLFPTRCGGRCFSPRWVEYRLLTSMSSRQGTRNLAVLPRRPVRRDSGRLGACLFSAGDGVVMCGWFQKGVSCRATRACFSWIVYTCICPPAGRGLQLAGLDKEGGGEMLFLLYILTNV